MPSPSSRPSENRNEPADLDRAWSEVRQMIDRAATLGRFKDDGGEVVGYWPPRPEELDAAGRQLRLYHKTFDPLSGSEADGIGRGWLKDGLPTVLRQFLTRCSNGLEFASADFVILGQRRRKRLDPESGFSGVTADGQMKLKFARWGSDLIWMDVDTGSIGVAPTGTRYLRTWDTFTKFLVEGCRDHLASFDIDGRRIGFAALPVPAPLPSSLDFLPSQFQARAARVGTIIKRHRRVTVGGTGYEIFPVPQLPAQQVGYGIDAEGNLMGGQGAGAWKSQWLVIGIDGELGDPLIVDLSTDSLTVLTAMHGAGRWEPEPVADSLEALFAKP